jgi:hypothetical protein
VEFSRCLALSRYLAPSLKMLCELAPRARDRLMPVVKSRSDVKLSSDDCSSSSDAAKSSFSGLAWMSSGSIESAPTLGAKTTSSWRKVE